LAASNIVVEGLTVQSKPWYVLLHLQVNDPNVGGSPSLQVNRVEVTWATVNDRSQGTTFTAQSFNYALHTGIVDGNTYYYWIRPIDNSSNAGDYYPLSATQGVAIQVTATPTTTFSLINGTLDVRADGGGNLICAVKYLTGTDPTPLFPVLLPVINTSGGYSTIAVVAPLSFTIPNGATYGFVANARSRIWWLAFDIGGSLILAGFNNQNGDLVYGLAEQGVANATLITTAADFAGIVYGSVAVTNKPYKMLGYSDWDVNVLATPGTWVSPSRTIQYGAGSAGLQSRPGPEVVSSAAGVPARIGFGSIDPQDLTNISLAVSATGGSITCALKASDGTNPSETNPIIGSFPNVPRDGTRIWRRLASALSVVLGPGSTLDTLANIPFRVWWILFDNAGTPVMGAFKSVGSSRARIQVLSELLLYLGLQENSGTPQATQSGFIYITAGLSINTPKAIRILGYTEFPSGCPFSGSPAQWTLPVDAFTVVRFPGMKLPGDTVVTAPAYFRNSVTSNTGTIPLDNTPPQWTEGNLFNSLNVTMAATSLANILRYSGEIVVSHSAAVHVIVAIFYEATAGDAIIDGVAKIPAADDMGLIRLAAILYPVDLNSHTYAFRIGGSAAGTWTINGRLATNIFNAIPVSYTQIDELMT
jgi:hypothetical protein